MLTWFSAHGKVEECLEENKYKKLLYKLNIRTLSFKLSVFESHGLLV
jgi:hypothetical protein